jgi:hypothetical protein
MKLTPDARAQLVDTLQASPVDGSLTAAEVRAIAASFEISTGYVYRLAREGIAPRSRGSWLLTEQAVELYYEKRGRVSAVHAATVDGGEKVPSLRQLQRAFATQPAAPPSATVALLDTAAVRRLRVQARLFHLSRMLWAQAPPPSAALSAWQEPDRPDARRPTPDVAYALDPALSRPPVER